MPTIHRCYGILLIAATTFGCVAQANLDEQSPGVSPAGPVVIAEVHHDTSAPLSELVAAPATIRQMPERETRPAPPQAAMIDPLAQAAVQAAAAPSLLTNVEGLGAGMPTGVYGFPSDTNSAVGATPVRAV